MRRTVANVHLLLPQADEKIRAGSKIRQNLLKLLKMLDYGETALREAMVEDGQSGDCPSASSPIQRKRSCQATHLAHRTALLSYTPRV